LLTTTGGPGGEARVWDAATGQPMTPPLSRPDWVAHASFTPDGRRLFAVFMRALGKGEEYRVDALIYDANTGRELVTLVKDTYSGWEEQISVALSPDGRLAAILMMEGAGGQVFDTVTGQPVREVGEASGAAFSPDSRRLVLRQRNSVWIQDVATGKVVVPNLAHGLGVVDARFSPDGHRVVTLTEDGGRWVWRATTGALVAGPAGHGPGQSGSVTLSPNGLHGIPGYSDRVWHLGTGEAITAPLKPASGAVFSPDGGRVATVAGAGVALLWDIAWKPPEVLPSEHQGIASFPSPDGTRLLVLSNDGTAQVWDTTTGQRVGLPLKPPGARFFGPREQVSWSANGRRLLMNRWAPSGGAIFEVGDTSTGRWVRLHQQAERFPDVSLSPDGNRVLTVSDGIAQVWDAETGRELFPALAHEGLSRAAFSPDGRRLLTAGAEAWLRDAATGRPLLPAVTPGGKVEHLQFSPSGDRFLIGTHDQEQGTSAIRTWDTTTGRPAATVLELPAVCRAVDFSPDGRFLFTTRAGGEDLVPEARVWDAATARPIGPPLKHFRHWAASFSPDGRLVLTAGSDDTMRLYDTATGRAVSPPLPPGGPRSEFSPDSRLLRHAGRVWDTATGEPVTPPGDDRRVWQLPPDERPLEDLERLAQVLSGRRIDEAGGYVPVEAAAFRESWTALVAKYGRSFLAAGAAEALAWHRQAARDCAAAEEWPGAILHLDRLIDAAPASAKLHYDRGAAHAALGRWDRAADDFARAQDPHKQALTLLAAGRDGEYRRACAALLKNVGLTEHADLAQKAAWACALAADAGVGRDRVVTLAEVAVAKDEKSFPNVRALGAALYRAGRYEEAVTRLSEATILSQDAPTAWLFLAMAQHRMGKTDEARQWLNKVAQWLAEAGAQGQSLTWVERLEVKLLRAEAEALFKAPPGNP
jgi:WD40 repeat protein/tetratricopeptide (TPR) repeat protein